MENASKALLMAGGILIAMLIISIGVFLFANYSDFGSSYDQTMQASEIQKFNTNFTKFEGRSDITIQEIVTLASFAKQYEEQTETHITVVIVTPLKGDITKSGNEEFIGLIKDYSDIKFQCVYMDYFTDGNEKGKIKTIVFQ